MRPLRLEYRPSPLRPAAAWLIAGSDPAAWLAEITRWGVDDSRCQLYVLPRSPQDFGTGAVMVLTGGQLPRCAPAAAAFGILAGRIYLPVDAALLPAVTDGELAAFASSNVIVIHPVVGAVACERALRVADLLRPLAEIDDPFVDARPVRVAHPRIESIGFRVQESLDGMFDAMRDDIGTAPPENLPPAKGEISRNPIARGWRTLRMGALRAGHHMITGNGPGGGRGPFGKMREWIEKQIESLGSELAKMRNREIHRLLEKLRDDPDEALRHALPLTSAMNRGLAPPSTKLGTRSTDFNLGNLRGGQPADNWNLDYEMQRQLRDNYVRLAERERQLGRFRRSAYIYAELLGDLSSAALVLKEGNHWREAALIYRDHLTKPHDAARCFIEARMPAEAIAILQKERAWEELGGLHRKLGDEVAAEAAFREWVNELLASGQTVKAADVLLHQLNSRSAALELLAAQWPDGSHAEACVRRFFDLHGESGDHVAARASLAVLFKKESSLGQVHPLINWLAHVAQSYPDRAVRLSAEEAGRQCIARRLNGPEIAERKRLISRLNELVAEDRLLPRDVQRFLDLRPAQKQAPLRGPSPKEPGSTALALHRDHQLPYHGINWTNAVAGDQLVILAGIAPSCVAACRLEFDGATHSTQWGVPAGPQPHLVMAAPGAHLPHTFLSAFPDVPLAIRVLASSPTAAGGDFAVGTPTWGDGVIGAAMGTTALWLLRVASHGWVVSGHRNDGAIVGQFPVNMIPSAEALADLPENYRPCITACLNDVAVACANVLMLFRSRPGSVRQVVECDSTLLELVSAPRWAIPHLALVMADRVEICWLSGDEPMVFSAIRDLEKRPVAGFSTDGTLVVIAGTAGWLIDADSRGQRKVARFVWEGAEPISVLPGPAARTFTTVEHSGRVRVWRFSPGDLK